MVRVISVHHFANQHIQTVEQPTACTVAPPDRLLLALTNNCIEVRDLSQDSNVLFTFPTVDEACQILHCLNGDYVASLETKFNRQNRETNFVRIYINWDSVATLQQSKMTSSGVSLGHSECGMVQPMRARIAGRVTPTTNQSELGSLEMIEIPVKRNPNYIACCQVSGNLAILSHRIVNMYRFQLKTHHISKLKFIDFEELPILIEMSFTPSEILTTENYLSAMNRDTLQVFKIIMAASVVESNGNGHFHGDNEEDFSFLYSNNEPIDFQQLKKQEELNKKNIRKEKFTVNLPTITKENSLIHKHSPFTFTDKDLIAVLKPSSPVDGRIQGYKIENLIQLRLVPIQIENAQRHVTEEFKSMVLKPLYIDQNFNAKNFNEWESNILKSDYKKCLNAVAFMVATQQEGYLFYFGDKEDVTEKDNCIAVYPFTAPVYKLVIEDYFLHALTETGLESYTLRIGHQLCRNFEAVDNINVACPPIDDCVCLVGLRPFLGVEKILLSENHMVLLANSDESSPAHSVSSSGSSTVYFLTLYNLELPTPKTIFNDISIVANVHRFSLSQTYCHLMSEAHMILRMALVLKKWTMTDENVKLIIPVRERSDGLVDTYRTSCALLGDHYILCNTEENYTLAIPYYKMAGVTPLEVLNRVKKIQDQNNVQFAEGLIHYLKHTLLEIKTGLDADKYFRTSSKHNFAESILELLKNHGYSDLPGLILKSKILREYSTDKLITILSENYIDNEVNLSEKYLALTILHLQKSNSEEAEFYLRKIPQEKLIKLLLENWDLFFDTTYIPQSKKVTANMSKGSMTFSELSVLLISVYPNLLSEMLVKLIVEKRVVNLFKIIKVFLEYLPSSIGQDSNFASQVLQRTLESYFSRYFAKPENTDLSKIIYERGASEAMKLLVRSYLSQLQVLQIRDETGLNRNNNDKDSLNKKATDNESQETDNDDTEKDRDQEKLRYNTVYKTYFEESVKKPKDTFLFCELKHEYFDKMPPFQVNIIQKLYEICIDNYPVLSDCQQNEEADKVLRKLQALLCSQVVPKQVITEVSAFLSVNENLRGNIALKSVTLPISDAIPFLTDRCPQCLLQFGKDRFTKSEEWKLLIATLQNRILKLTQNSKLKRICFFHKKLLRDILTYVASNFGLDKLHEIFPEQKNVELFSANNNEKQKKSDEEMLKNIENDEQDILKDLQNYEPYIQICKDTIQANNINKMLTTKAQQLLCTLNL